MEGKKKNPTSKEVCIANISGWGRTKDLVALLQSSHCLDGMHGLSMPIRGKGAWQVQLVLPLSILVKIEMETRESDGRARLRIKMKTCSINEMRKGKW